ncbi:MAG: hypothetical protein AAGF55_01735 [Pseudomonadota bacterium]
MQQRRLNHPKWNETNLYEDVPGWTRAAPAQEYIATSNWPLTFCDPRARPPAGRVLSLLMSISCREEDQCASAISPAVRRFSTDGGQSHPGRWHVPKP